MANIVKNIFLINFRRINVLHNLISFRYKTVRISQIESKTISKADRIKKLYKDSKTLYGAKIKEKGKKVAVVPVDDDEVKNDKDMSSEIYWMCLHVPEVQDFTEPAKLKIKKKKNVEVDLEALPGKPKKAKAPKASQKKLDIEEVAKPTVVKEKKTTKPKPTKTIAFAPELPDSLTKLHNALPDVSAEIRSAFNSALNIKSADDKPDEPEIPFGIQQLNEIPNFPLVMSKSKIIASFEKPAGVRPLYLPSVSKILQATMPESQRNALVQWKQLKISELGLEGFEIMQKCEFNISVVLVRMLDHLLLLLAHLSRGKQFHTCLQQFFEGDSIVKSDLPGEVLEIWKSIEPLLKNFKTPGMLIEEKLEHPYLLYQGVVDCVSFHKENLCVIEWKKSDRLKKSLSFTYDAPVQLCSYLGALNASRNEFHDCPIKNGVIVVAYNDGQKADLFELNEQELKKYWKLWLNRLQEYWVRYKDNTLPEAI